MKVNGKRTKLQISYHDGTKQRIHEMIAEESGPGMKFFGMLEEMEVVQAVSLYLNSHGFPVKKTVTYTRETGNDILAVAADGTEMIVEAKGQTSSDKTTKKYGMEFSRSQKEDHLGRALLESCQNISKGRFAGIRLPAN